MLLPVLYVHRNVATLQIDNVHGLQKNCSLLSRLWVGKQVVGQQGHSSGGSTGLGVEMFGLCPQLTFKLTQVLCSVVHSPIPFPGRKQV